MVGRQNLIEEEVGVVFPQVCVDEDEDKYKGNYNKMTTRLTNYVAQRFFIGGLTRPSPHPFSDDGPLIMIMPRPSMEEIVSCYADDRGRERDPRVHDGKDCAGYRCEVIGGDGGESPFPHPTDASISSPVVRGVEGDMKILKEGSLEFLPQTDAS